MCDFSELKKNKQAYTQPSHPSAIDVCIANNVGSNNQTLQMLKDITQYIRTYIKYVFMLRVHVNSSFDVEQLKHINSLIKYKHLKVSCTSNIHFYLCDNLYLNYIS